MTIGEQFYLGLVLTGFVTFGIVLAVISTSTNRYVRRQAAKAAAERLQTNVKKAA